MIVYSQHQNALRVFQGVENLQHLGNTLLHDVGGQVAIQGQASDVLRQPGLDDPQQSAASFSVSLLCLSHQRNVIFVFAHLAMKRGDRAAETLRQFRPVHGFPARHSPRLPGDRQTANEF